MLKKIVTFGVQRALGGTNKSWVFSSGALLVLRAVRSVVGKRETIDLSNTKPGDKILIEHLPITHKQQMKQFKSAERSDKSANRAAKKTSKRLKKSAKAARSKTARSKTARRQLRRVSA